MNLATIIVLLVVFVLVIIAIKTLCYKGSCACGKNAKQAGKDEKCVGCSADCPFKR